MGGFWNTVLLLLPVFFPVACGLIILLWFGGKPRAMRIAVVAAVLLLQPVLNVLAWRFCDGTVVLFRFTDRIVAELRVDWMAGLFTGLLSAVWLFAGFFSFEYMKHEEGAEHAKEHTKSLSGNFFYGFYLMVLGVMTGAGYAGNLLTFYLFYEFMTLLSMPFVLHTMTKEAIFAAKKYLFYSIGGASFALFGFAFFYLAAGSTEFVPGGLFASGLPADREGILLVAVFLLIFGFGAKAGMFPLHGWLPSAHPVAPAPASAVMSGIITKVGVLGMIRAVFYVVGAENLRGTWVQYAFLALSLVTVFMGSMLAYKEKMFKKRLAYSTVSQVSYVLFGLAVLQPAAFVGALLHMVFHALMKSLLFFNAGAVIYKTGKTKVEELAGIGKTMPVTMGTFTVAALGLVGIPPMCGFVSKWYLCVGALHDAPGAFAYIGPAVLLVSALLTAGYLLSIMVKAFFPGEEWESAALEKQKSDAMLEKRDSDAVPGKQESDAALTKQKPNAVQKSGAVPGKQEPNAVLAKQEPNAFMLVPMLVLAAATVLLGLFPGGLYGLAERIASTLF